MVLLRNITTQQFRFEKEGIFLLCKKMPCVNNALAHFVDKVKQLNGSWEDNH